VKKILWLLLLFTATARAQSGFPDGVANTYTLGQKEGYSGFIYSSIGFGADGTVYTCDYSGTIEIHSNNNSIKIDTLKKWGMVGGFKITGPGEAWLIGLRFVAVLKNHQVIKLLKLPDGIFSHAYRIHEKTAFFFAAKNDSLETWEFNGDILQRKAVSPIRIDLSQAWLLENTNKKAWLFRKVNKAIDIFLLNNLTGQFEFKKTYPGLRWIWAIQDENNLCGSTENPGKNDCCKINDGIVLPFSGTFGDGLDNSYNLFGANGAGALYKYQNGKFYTVAVDSNFNLKKELPFSFNDNINTVPSNIPGNLYFGFTGNRMLLVNPFIKKYPFVFDQSNSAAIFTLKEDSLGRIWAGSYQTNLSLIDHGKIIPVKNNRFKMMNGGTYYNGHMYLIGEGTGGLLQYDMNGHASKLNTATTGFYTYLSRNNQNFYYTTLNHLGLWQTTTSQLETIKPVWNKIDTTKGMQINHILTITEDTTGRIWCGHPNSGIAVYDPQTDKATTWLIENNQSAFGSFSSVTDAYGTVWMGGDKGLWYYNDYSKAANPQNCHRIEHPLLLNNKMITAMTISGTWLIIAAYDKVLLLDINEFHRHQKPMVRYLNPYETAFTSFTEQNTLLTAKDSTVWFSTSDMLYQWDINRWLSQPVYKATVSVLLTGHEKERALVQDKTLLLPPGSNSFDLQLRYLSPDNMLRFISAGLLKVGSTDSLPAPSLQSDYSFKNLGSGSYRFIVEVYETDGSTTRYVYKIIIRKFLWQEWWFWALISTIVAGIIFYFADLRRKRQIAEQKTKTKEAELLSFRNEQEKKLANLQLVTLSSQFRPHFILNALNTIGAKMDNHPELETVLSRLGDSVNLIFNHAQQQKILHPFINEWKLVTNVIHIHRLMYLKQLETTLPDDAMLNSIKDMVIPLGILQIPIENALLHGLSNRETGPWRLNTNIREEGNMIIISIADNGVGRKKSATLSNFTRHGTGNRNLEEIIQIINAANTEKISIQFRDDIYQDGTTMYGTEVIISLPKNLLHDN
jgi:Histidine kinase